MLKLLGSGYMVFGYMVFLIIFDTLCMVNDQSDFSDKFFGCKVISAIWSVLAGPNVDHISGNEFISVFNVRWLCEIGGIKRNFGTH